jgi:hypothetical protein
MDQDKLADYIAERVWKRIEATIDAKIDQKVRNSVEEYLGDIVSGCMDPCPPPYPETELESLDEPISYIPMTDDEEITVHGNGPCLSEVSPGKYVDDFLHDYCILSDYEDVMTSVEDLYQAYCAIPGMLRMSKTMFGKCLTSHTGLPKQKVHGRMYYVGVETRGE